MTDPIRAALERLLARLDETTDPNGPVPAWSDSFYGARAALAQPEPVGELPSDYIDPGHTAADRELLEAFYRATRSEGGTADEIYLRGIHAAIALRRRAPVQAAEGEEKVQA